MFKNLKSLFIVEEPDKLKAKTPVTKNKTTSSSGNKIVKVTKPSSSTTPTNTSIQTPASGKPNAKFTEILLKAMEQNNLEGLDYLEFKQSLVALSKMPMDEATRYQSAFAMASSMGVTPDKLIQTANFYLDILAKEEGKFQNALAQQNQSKVGNKQAEIESLEKTIQEKAAHIKKLTEEITAIQNKVETKKKSIAEATSKITETKLNFVASYQALTGQIKADVANMKKYLNGGAK